MIYLTMTNIPPDEWHVVVDETRRVIGRSSEADIPIWPKYSTVSRRHAVIWKDHRGIWIRDLGSRGGTCLNGVWLEEDRPVLLAVGDRIRLATLELQLVNYVLPPKKPLREEASSESEDHERTEAYGTAPLPMRVLCESLTPAEYEVVLWICRGVFDDAELGRVLHRSPNTIRTHVSNILRKLNLHSRQELVGWLRLREP